jgi:hypothetical protein
MLAQPWCIFWRTDSAEPWQDIAGAEMSGDVGSFRAVQSLTVPELNADELEQARKFVVYGEGAPPFSLSGQSVDPIRGWIAARE